MCVKPAGLGWFDGWYRNNGGTQAAQKIPVSSNARAKFRSQISDTMQPRWEKAEKRKNRREEKGKRKIKSRKTLFQCFVAR